MKIRHLLPALFLFLFAFSTHAEILFEGYYKVTQFKKHIGVAILRHEIDEKTKSFKTTSFIKLGKLGFDMTESYQAVSDSAFVPVSLSYLAVNEKKTKTIEAKVKNLTMTGTVVEDGKKIKLNAQLPKGAFFSSALYYIMLQSKDGLKSDTKFDYVGITEEGPVAMNGSVAIDKKLVSQGATQLLKVNCKFAGSDYDSLVTNRGEIVNAFTPATNIESELVKSPTEALEGIKLANGTLEKIFGNKPDGKKNSLYGKK